MKAHTYYIIFGRPPIGGKLPPFPPGGATVYYHLFNLICSSYINMYSLVAEIWKFKERQFVSQVASTEMSFVVCTRGGQSSDKHPNMTTALNKSLLITILHCNIYLALKYPGKLCFPLWTASYWQKRHCLCNSRSHQCSKAYWSGARFTKYLTTILRLSYDNAKVTIDLRRMSNLQNILQWMESF